MKFLLDWSEAFDEEAVLSQVAEAASIAQIVDQFVGLDEEFALIFGEDGAEGEFASNEYDQIDDCVFSKFFFIFFLSESVHVIVHNFKCFEGYPQRLIVFVFKFLEVGQVIQAGDDENGVDMGAFQVGLAFFEYFLGLIDFVVSGVKGLST